MNARTNPAMLADEIEKAVTQWQATKTAPRDQVVVVERWLRDAEVALSAEPVAAKAMPGHLADAKRLGLLARKVASEIQRTSDVGIARRNLGEARTDAWKLARQTSSRSLTTAASNIGRAYLLPQRITTGDVIRILQEASQLLLNFAQGKSAKSALGHLASARDALYAQAPNIGMGSGAAVKSTVKYNFQRDIGKAQNLAKRIRQNVNRGKDNNRDWQTLEALIDTIRRDIFHGFPPNEPDNGRTRAALTHASVTVDKGRRQPSGQRGYWIEEVLEYLSLAYQTSSALSKSAKSAYDSLLAAANALRPAPEPAHVPATERNRREAMKFAGAGDAVKGANQRRMRQILNRWGYDTGPREFEEFAENSYELSIIYEGGGSDLAKRALAKVRQRLSGIGADVFWANIMRSGFNSEGWSAVIKWSWEPGRKSVKADPSHIVAQGLQNVAKQMADANRGVDVDDKIKRLKQVYRLWGLVKNGIPRDQRKADWYVHARNAEKYLVGMIRGRHVSTGAVTQATRLFSRASDFVAGSHGWRSQRSAKAGGLPHHYNQIARDVRQIYLTTEFEDDFEFESQRDHVQMIADSVANEYKPPGGNRRLQNKHRALVRLLRMANPHRNNWHNVLRQAERLSKELAQSIHPGKSAKATKAPAYQLLRQLYRSVANSSGKITFDKSPAVFRRWKVMLIAIGRADRVLANQTPYRQAMQVLNMGGFQNNQQFNDRVGSLEESLEYLYNLESKNPYQG